LANGPEPFRRSADAGFGVSWKCAVPESEARLVNSSISYLIGHKIKPNPLSFDSFFPAIFFPAIKAARWVRMPGIDYPIQPGTKPG